jgi:hypothetical protein
MFFVGFYFWPIPIYLGLKTLLLFVVIVNVIASPFSQEEENKEENIRWNCVVGVSIY